ncbi:MAG TPA: radical SAM protein [candidate division WOR-3 bacterium]|uniref:Radical SAM protein n=1 Tax=candidate division WOR-3 bacterium TaxID=2052148 RepID=A0A9C9EPE1_UNCW3|nr:radical SAM protein [candidate division WOR-3 bacterium]
MKHNTGTLINLFIPNRKTSRPLHPLPMGCLSLLAVLEKNRLFTKFYDYQFYAKRNPFDPANIVALVEPNLQWLGISCLNDMLPFACLAADGVKKIYPHITIILGGPGPTPVAEELLKTFSFIDVVVRGEGEETIVELVKQIVEGKSRDFSNIKGIVYRARTGEIISNPPRPRIKDLNTLPLPAFSKVDLHRYNSFSFMTTRGCPFRCAFCEVGNIWGQNVYRYSVTKVGEILEYLYREHHIEKISFDDDNFVLDRNRVHSICNELGKRNIKLTWNCLARVDAISLPLLKKMKEYGCEGIFYGIESGDNSVLSQIKSNVTVEQSVAVVYDTLEAQLNPTVSFIWGFPFENINQFYKTLFLTIFFRLLGCQERIALLSSCRGSPLYKKFGKKLCTDRTIMETNPNVSIKPIGKYNYQLVDLILQYPQLFSSFYTYEHKDLRIKNEIMQKFMRWWPG